MDATKQEVGHFDFIGQFCCPFYNFPYCYWTNSSKAFGLLHFILGLTHGQFFMMKIYQTLFPRVSWHGIYGLAISDNRKWPGLAQYIVIIQTDFFQSAPNFTSLIDSQSEHISTLIESNSHSAPYW